MPLRAVPAASWCGEVSVGGELIIILSSSIISAGGDGLVGVVL